MTSLLKTWPLIALITTSWAMECKGPNPDLRPQMGPVRDQDTVGWCYAFSAADQIGHWMSRHRGEIPAPYSQMDFTQRENMVSASAVANQFYHAKAPINGEIKKKFTPELTYQLNHQLEQLELQATELCQQFDINWQNKCELGQIAFCQNQKTTELCKVKDTNFWDKTKPLIQQYSEVIAQLRDARYPLFQFLQGGDTEVAIIEGTRDGIFFEKDVPSDNYSSGKRFSDIYQNLNSILTGATSYEQARCQIQEELKVILPTASFEELNNAISDAYKLKTDPLFALLNRPSLRKNIKIAPKIIRDTDPNTKYIGFLFDPVARRREFLIDQLSEGKIVEIEYRPRGIIMPSSEKSHMNDQHSSTIVGKTCLHGKEHFILRNSWGPQQCKQHRFDMILTKLNSSKLPAKKYNSCINTCFDLGNWDKKIECRLKCYEDHLEEIYQVTDFQFDCDDQGNYLVRPEELLNDNTTQKLLVME